MLTRWKFIVLQDGRPAYYCLLDDAGFWMSRLCCKETLTRLKELLDMRYDLGRNAREAEQNAHGK